VADDGGYARWVVHYSEAGTADRIETHDRNDRLAREDIIRRTSANAAIITFERENVPLTQSAAQDLVLDSFAPADQAASAKSEITRHQLTFDANGFIVELRYQDHWGMPRRDAQGSFGKHFTRSAEGLALRLAEIGPDGAEITLKNGLRAVTFAYDQDYNFVRHTLIGADNKPFAGGDGFAYYVRNHDRWGNLVATTYYGLDGKPTLNRNSLASITVAFDARGNSTEARFFGVDGAPTLLKDGGHAKVAWKHDAQGYEIERSFFDAEGNPTLIKQGNAGMAWVRDARGNVLEERYLGVDGKPILRPTGIAGFRNTFDARGNRTEASYFGVDGELKLSNERIARITYLFNDKDEEVRRAFFGVDGKPTLLANGFAGFEQEYLIQSNSFVLQEVV